jgi:hypothetical protein
MAYKKKSYRSYDNAFTRLASLKSIDPKMDLNNGLSIDVYESAIIELKTRIDGYNTHLSLIDGMKNAIGEMDKKVRDLNERMLSGVASKYGKDSDEYEKAGGVKKSERKKRGSKLQNSVKKVA